jgi:hypothetical protein
MRLFLLFSFLICFASSITAQNGEETAVIAVVQRLFAGMYAADAAMVKAALHQEVQLKTIALDKENKITITTGDLKAFLTAVGTKRPQPLDEKLWNFDVRIDENLASVWSEYSLFFGDQFVHCGVDAFQLIKTESGWKIFQIADTRHKDFCRQKAPDYNAEIGTVIDTWHRSAAIANEDGYFDAMTPDAIFLGTDASERWSRDTMRVKVHNAFTKKSAWDFKSKNRSIMVAPNGQLAWWDELLDTWMGPCRGSGVLVLTPQGWKIKHFNLAILVPNDKVNSYLKLIGK